MAIFEDDNAPPRPAAVHVMGQDLGAISVDELAARVVALKAEIVRLEAEIAAKTAQRNAADQLFRR